MATKKLVRAIAVISPVILLVAFAGNTLADKSNADIATLVKRLDEIDLAREHIALTLAKINHVNKKAKDAFLTALVESRSDLAGLPFLKGEACRMSEEVSRKFVDES